MTNALNNADFDADLLAEMQANGLFSEEEIASIAEKANEVETKQTLASAENEIPEISLADVSETELPDEALADLESAVAAQELKEQVYASQESSAQLNVTEDQTPPAAPAKTQAPKKAGGANNPPKRTPRVADGSVGAYVAKLMGDTVSLAPGHSVAIAPIVDTMPKKIAEKCANVFEAVAKGKPPSVFVRVGLDILKNEGAVSGKRMVEVFNGGAAGKVYSIGTARSQSQQIVSLFKTLALTDASGKLNPNSTLWAKLAA